MAEMPAKSLPFLLALVAITSLTEAFVFPSVKHEEIKKEVKKRDINDFTQEELQQIQDYLSALSPQDIENMSPSEREQLFVLLYVIGPEAFEKELQLESE
uniref:Uncharacterized protein n=1 Tax=Strigamia maritima TaxID=126957 RepID=T1IUW2_STRMM